MNTTAGEIIRCTTLVKCISDIVEDLKARGYKNPHQTDYMSQHNKAIVILAGSPDGKVNLAIEVYSWGEVKS